MNKKIILLILILFLLCGCSAEVNLNIATDGVYEEVKINALPDNYYTKEQLNTVFRQYIPAFANNVIVDTEPDQASPGIQYYQRKVNDIGNGYSFTYNYKFNLSNYKNATTIKNAFKSVTIQDDKVDNKIMLTTDSGGLLYFEQYPSLQEVKVNITSDYKVLNHNADYVNGNVYTWVLNRNFNNKNVYIQYDKKLGSSETPEGEDDDKKDDIVIKNEPKKEEDNVFVKFINEHPFITVLCAIVLFLVFVIIFSKLSKVK